MCIGENYMARIPCAPADQALKPHQSLVGVFSVHSTSCSCVSVQHTQTHDIKPRDVVSVADDVVVVVMVIRTGIVQYHSMYG